MLFRYCCHVLIFYPLAMEMFLSKERKQTNNFYYSRSRIMNCIRTNRKVFVVSPYFYFYFHFYFHFAIVFWYFCIFVTSARIYNYRIYDIFIVISSVISHLAKRTVISVTFSQHIWYCAILEFFFWEFFFCNSSNYWRRRIVDSFFIILIKVERLWQRPLVTLARSEFCFELL